MVPLYSNDYLIPQNVLNWPVTKHPVSFTTQNKVGGRVRNISTTTMIRTLFSESLSCLTSRWLSEDG